VARYYQPAEFAELADEARAAGIRGVLSGPLVRSSYHAGAFGEDEGP
jgi:lipoic acid synthetase